MGDIQPDGVFEELDAAFGVVFLHQDRGHSKVGLSLLGIGIENPQETIDCIVTFPQAQQHAAGQQ